MSEKASGNAPSSPESLEPQDEARPVGPIGEEVTVDPEAGDQLDPVECWWDDASEEDGGARNRKIDSEENAHFVGENGKKAKKAVKEDPFWLDDVAATPGADSDESEQKEEESNREEESILAPVTD